MIELKNISRVYQMGDQTIKALDNVDLTINDGEYIAIIGPSGSGKSTLMNVLGCLDNPSSGQYFLNGKDVSKLRDDQLADARNKNIGFVFQRFNLMGRMSAMRNVEMPARYGGLNSGQRHKNALAALSAVGLADRVDHKPVELSGGQQQRVAIARALVNQPNILLADEPTGALDSKTGRDILDLFERLHQERGITVIVVTHDPNVARRANRVVSIRDGRIESDLGNEHYASANGVLHHEDEHVGHAPAMATAGNDKAAVPAAATVAVAAGVTSQAVSAAPAGAPVPAATEAATTSTKPGAGPIWKRGLIAVAIAAVVNVALAVLAGVLSPFAARLPFFSPPVIAGATLLIGVLAVAFFVLLNSKSAKPVKVFRLAAAGVLVLSLVPGVLFLTNPLTLFQFAGTSQRGQFAGGQAGAAGGLANAGQTTQTTRGNRGVPGIGPLGSIFGSNATGTQQRANGGIATALPAILLMAMPLLSFLIIVPALTRKPRHATAKLNTSGLT